MDPIGPSKDISAYFSVWAQSTIRQGPKKELTDVAIMLCKLNKSL